MTFSHASEIRTEHPTLVAAVLHVGGIEPGADVGAHVADAGGLRIEQALLQETGSRFQARERGWRW